MDSYVPLFLEKDRFGKLLTLLEELSPLSTLMLTTSSLEEPMVQSVSGPVRPVNYSSNLTIKRKKLSVFSLIP